MAIRFHEKTKEFHIFNGEVSYLMRIMENGQLENLYYGKAVRDKEDFSYLHEEAMRSQMSVCIPEPGNFIDAVYKAGISGVWNRRLQKPCSHDSGGKRQQNRGLFLCIS